MSPRKTTRRSFLVRSTVLSAGLAGGLSIARSAHAAGDETLKIALVGVGGRGKGAVRDALSSQGPIKLVALADVFEEKLASGLKTLQSVEAIKDRIDVPPEHLFAGFDAYQKILALDIDIVLLCTPPAFRPLQYAAAVAAGKHVFMEKPCCVDGPGYRQVMAANQLADDKGLKVVVGLQRRHQASYLEGMKRVHGGEVGDMVTIRTYFNMPSGGHSDAGKSQSLSELAWQIQRWNYFTWLSGDHIVEQAVHEIDIANWMMKDEPPVRAMGWVAARHAPAVVTVRSLIITSSSTSMPTARDTMPRPNSSRAAGRMCPITSMARRVGSPSVRARTDSEGLRTIRAERIRALIRNASQLPAPTWSSTRIWLTRSDRANRSTTAITAPRAA